MKNESKLIVDIKNASKVYSTEAGEFRALSDINIRVEKGEFLGIVGKSGAGKSTLLNMITGVRGCLVSSRLHNSADVKREEQ